MFKKSTVIGVFALFIFINSCTSDLNLSPNTSFTINGNWALPLVHGKLNMAQLVNDTSIIADEDGLVHIIYRNDSLYRFDAHEYTQIPDQDAVETTIKVGNPPLEIRTNLGTLGGAKMKSIGIENGEIYWTVNNSTNTTITVSVEILNATQNGIPIILLINATQQGLNTGTISLANLNLDLTQGTPAFNNVGFVFKVMNGSGAPVGSDVPITVKLKNLRIKSAIGFFGERKINLPSGKIALGLGVLESLSKGISLREPRIHFFVTSNVGLPIALKPNIIGVTKNGASQNLGLSTFNFLGAPTIGTFATDSFLISASNSRLEDFLALVPNQILYSGSVDMNPAGQTLKDNFITNDARLKIGMEIDLPLHFKARNVTLEETFKNVDFGVDETDYHFLESLTLGFRTENGFPLAAELTTYFIDSTGQIIDSVNFSVFDAATVDATGLLVAPAKHERFLTFTKQDLDAIMRSRDIKIVVRLNTSGNGNQDVKILTDYYYDVIIGAKVKLNYKL